MNDPLRMSEYNCALTGGHQIDSESRSCIFCGLCIPHHVNVKRIRNRVFSEYEERRHIMAKKISADDDRERALRVLREIAENEGLSPDDRRHAALDLLEARRRGG